MKSPYPFTFLTFILLLLGCGGTTKIVDSWKDPSFIAPPKEQQKVVISVMAHNEVNRRAAEDKMVSMSASLMQSYLVFPNKESAMDKRKAKQILEEKGFTGVMTMRLVTSRQTETYVPPSSSMYMGYGGYWGYYGASWGAYYSPGYYQTDLEYFIESSVYSIKDNQLVWSAITNTVNPSNINQTLNDVSRTVMRQLLADDILKR